MIKLNNKGQSLVMFVLVLPILLIAFIIVYDIGNALFYKQELDNVNYLALDYALEHIDSDNIESKIIDIINLNNLSLNEIEVIYKNNKIYVTTKKKVSGVITKSFDILTVKSSYVGYTENNKKMIERV